MQLKQILPQLFDEWVIDRQLKPGTAKVAIDDLINDFQGFLAERGHSLPVHKISLGKLLSRQFVKYQTKAAGMSVPKVIYFLSREL